MSSMSLVVGLLFIGLAFAATGLQGGTRDESFMLTNGCVNCHGFEGLRTPGPIPSLAGQPETYLFKILVAYRDGTLKGTIMNRVMQSYDDQTLRQLAVYYSRLPKKAVGEAAQQACGKGERLYEQHCASCHEMQADMPYVKGQNALFMQGVLKDMAEGQRTVPKEMVSAMSAINDEQLQQLLRYLQAPQQEPPCL